MCLFRTSFVSNIFIDSTDIKLAIICTVSGIKRSRGDCGTSFKMIVEITVAEPDDACAKYYFN